MPFPDGTPLGDILGDEGASGFRDIARMFTTEGVTSTSFTGGTQHSGTLKSLQTDPIQLGFGELELPGITAGTPFRLAMFDSPEGRWHLDLVLNGISLKLHDLHGADFVKETGTTPRRLIRRQTDTAVVISGEATIRFAKASASDPVALLFVENRSAADPLADTGAVVSLRCSPPHFFLGSSEFGMTLTQILFDASDTVSPPFITNLGQGPDWVGFAIAEATVYAPPNALGQGGFSGGVRNLLLGSPRGVQGEFEVQWGRAPLDPATFVFTQDGQTPVGATGGGNERLVAITAGQDDQVQMAVGFAAAAPPEGGTDTDWQATWRWPDGSETTGDNSAGQVGHGQILRVIPEEHVPGRPIIRHPEISFRFIAAGEIPEIDVITAGTSVVNAIHVAGPAADIAALSFRARSTAPTAGTFRWKMGANGAVQTGVSCTVPPAEIAGDDFLVLTETDGSGHARVARLRVQVAEGQPLLIGGEDGVVAASAPTAPLTPAAVEGTYDLPDFHARAHYRPVLDTALLDGTIPEKVAVPDGTLAIVTLESGAVPPSVDHDRHVQILFEFATGVARRWGDLRPVASPAGGSASDLHRQLLAWAANYPGADFLVVGRCDDLGDDALNQTLARTRRDTAVNFLTSAAGGGAPAPLALARVTGWGEQDGQPGSVATSPLDDEERTAQRLILATDDTTGDDLTDRTGWPDKRDTAHAAERVRESFRRVDIYAVGGTPAAAAVRQVLDPGRAPDLRRMSMPGETVDPVPAITSTPKSDYRIRLMGGWDKPTGEGAKDLIPSKAEFEFAWSPQDDPLPPLGGQPVDLGTEVLTIYGGWRHEDATGFTRTQLGIRSDGAPDGLFPPLEQPNLVAALALGPVLLSGVDSDTDTVEKAARITALAAGAGFASVLLKDGSNATFKKIEASAEIGNLDRPGDAYTVALTSDYSTRLHVDTGVLGLSTDPDRPVKLRYKDVSIRFDSTKSDFWDQVAIGYPTDAISIEDPGKWKIDGVLGKLLRAVETALGTGSIWIETRFAFALTIGVVEISEAVIRVTFDGASPIPAFSLRGLTAKVDIPNTLKGEGRLRIEDPGGVIKAGVDIEVIPLKLKASAAFAMASFTTPEPYTFINLFAKVQFPGGIPLGPSGCAIHGFIGQTVINGERDILETTPVDIVKREIGWWMKPPEDKYSPRKDQHALGLGVVIGTLPDASFSMSAQGMVVVAFPDPEVILGVEVNLLSVPDKTSKEKGGDQNAAIIGMVVIDDTAVSLAVAARYSIPKILELKAPFSAYFPYSGNGIYVRIGSDGQMGRAGEPVTLTLLPSTLDLKAFSYLMIEQDGLPNLGGDPRFSFDGFSVGFGAGAALEWKAGPIRLSASVLLLAGFGTNPILIKAGIFVKGELDLVVVSVSARGDIVLTYQNGNVSLDGEFCGKVDLFFFSVEGCVKFHIGSNPALTPPAPPPPAMSVVLTDRGGRIMGEALDEAKIAAGQTLKALPIFQMTEVDGVMQNTGADPKDNHTIWADTAPVINFAHYVKDAIPAGQQFDPTAQPSGEIWFGSNRLKYTYRLDNVRLVHVANGAEVAGVNPLKSAWVRSPARQAGSGGPQAPSGAEVSALKLLDWQPWDWALPMSDGGASAPGDPAGTIVKLCEPLPQPARACLYGKDARGAGPDRIRILHETPPPGPYPSRFTLAGRPGLRIGATILQGPALTALIAQTGGMVLPGAVVDLPQPVAGPTGPLMRGYRLPEAQTARDGTVMRTALPWLASLDRTIRRGRLLLMVCDGTARRPASDARQCYDFAGLSVGKEFAALDVPGFSLKALDPARPFLVTDEVDLSQGGAVIGADSRPDIRITAPGLIVEPRAPAREIELHLFRHEARPFDVKWTDRQGESRSLSDPGDEKGSVTLRLESDGDIAEIVIATRAKRLHLYRICVLGADKGQQCVDFRGAKKDQVASGRFSHGGHSFTVLNRDFGLRLVDWVDAAANPPRRGQDGGPELQFPDKGVEIVPDAPLSSISIGIFSGAGPVSASAFDASGAMIARVEDEARDPVDLHLSAPGIARVIVTGGNNEAIIFRLCHATDLGGETCHDFREISARPVGKLLVGDTVLVPAQRGQMLEVMDVIGGDDTVTTQPDGRLELLIPSGGLIMTPDAPQSRMTLYVATLGGERVEAKAFDARGNTIATATGGGSVEALSRLEQVGEGIARIELHAGEKSFLTQFCTGTKGGPADASGLPRVVTGQGESRRDWSPQVIGTIPSSRGGSCRIVAYDQPETLKDADGFDIVTPAGLRTTLLSLCGVDTSADLSRDEDAEAQQGLGDDVGASATGEVAVIAREILLDPGTDYRVEIDWSWQAWTSNEDGTDSPPATPPETVPGSSPPVSAWKAGPRQNFRFRVAAEDLVGGETQDGLNEYKFDPRDIARYLSRTEPADGRDVVFTDDPLWVHFDTGHVEALADRYGRKLDLWVRRTDPPPQPNQAAMDLIVFPQLLEMFWLKAPASTQSVAEQRINDAILAAPCLPDGPAVGGASLGARFKLEPNAMYDFNLIAPKKAPAGSDPVIVNPTRFKTSRYANPAEMMRALGFATSGTAPIAPTEMILADAAVLPAGPMQVSDKAMGDALVAIGADTLSLPGETGRTIALWRHLGGGTFGVAGVLIDAPEPLRRERAVLQGQQAVDSIRCEPDRITLGGGTFLPVCATLNWTRVLFVAPSPVTPTDAAPMSFRLKVAPGGTLTGRRIINARPVMLDTEGF
ncbi:hypothetical protein MLD63_00390 (plasmid) [Paracoccus sp. TK19116]|uniref:OmpA-like domain-containing protein n=1 Tax=Paracoccus albicereus TaxID=2922394 RepID=A0ABT1MKR0_9RHOB|nr:hypothetical protein [Paracoccus albicereus]MCQ0968894.1 hypothetical protein [Paracoccus albicereus]